VFCWTEGRTGGRTEEDGFLLAVLGEEDAARLPASRWSSAGNPTQLAGSLPRRAARAVVNAAQMCPLAAGLDYLCTTPLLFDFSAGVDGPTQQSTVIDIDAPASADDRYLEHILYDIRSYFPPPAYAAKF